MKITLDKIKNLFKKSSAPVTTDNVLHPHRHWIVLLWMFCAVIVALILFSLYLLFKIKNDQVFQVSDVKKETGNMLNQKLLDKVTDSFNQKAAKEEDIKTNRPSFSDPSL